MKLILVRHGETDSNLNRVIMGHSNIPLNERGQEQAELVAQRLLPERINFAYSSDLERAVRTADVILRYHPSVSRIPTPLLREKSYGVDEGKSQDEVQKMIQSSTFPFQEYKSKDGESYLELQQRAIQFYRGLFPQHDNDIVLAVSHGGWIMSLLLGIERLPFSLAHRQKYHHDNTAVTIIQATSFDQYFFEVLGDASHLFPKT